MKGIILFLCFFVLKTNYAQRYSYKEFMELSQKVHPLLVHLKGNIKTIEDSQKGTYHFENKKLIKHNGEIYLSEEEYEYDKFGYLSKIIVAENYEVEFITDSITHKLIEIREGEYVFEIIYNSQSVECNIRRKNEEKRKEIKRTVPSLFEYPIDKNGRVLQMFGGGKMDITYDKDGNVASIKVTTVGGICNYTTYFDKYFTKVYHGCEDIEPTMDYTDLDKYGNWQFGKAIQPLIGLKSRGKQEFFEVTRKYEYYEN